MFLRVCTCDLVPLSYELFLYVDGLYLPACVARFVLIPLLPPSAILHLLALALAYYDIIPIVKPSTRDTRSSCSKHLGYDLSAMTPYDLLYAVLTT